MGNMGNKNELTAAVAGMYFGCPVQTPKGVYSYWEFLTNNDLFLSKVKIEQDGYWHDLKNCKLILTPLSEITDEHAIGLQRLFNPSYPDPLNAGKEIIADFTSNEYFMSKFSVITSALAFLRSKSYDCDGLIELGIAITSKTTHDGI